MSRSRYRFGENEYAYFLTCTIVGWLPVFTRPETVQFVYDSWQFLQDNGRLTVYGYVILENHLHLIASAPDISKEIGDFKSFTARQIIDHLEAKNVATLLKWFGFLKARHKHDREHQVWQEGSHPQQIKDDEMMRQKLEYMHMNPLKRGYVDEAIHWRHSSARNYARLQGSFPVKTDWQYDTVSVGRDAERPDVRSHAERGNEE